MVWHCVSNTDQYLELTERSGARSVWSECACVMLPYINISRRKELKTDEYYSKASVQGLCVIPPKSSKILRPFRTAGSMNTPRVRMNLSLDS